MLKIQQERWKKQNRLTEENIERIKLLFRYFRLENKFSIEWNGEDNEITFVSGDSGSLKKMKAVLNMGECCICMQIGFRRGTEWYFRDYLDKENNIKKFSGVDPFYNIFKWFSNQIN